MPNRLSARAFVLSVAITTVRRYENIGSPARRLKIEQTVQLHRESYAKRHRD
jgi:hypothetical protein